MQAVHTAGAQYPMAQHCDRSIQRPLSLVFNLFDLTEVKKLARVVSSHFPPSYAVF